METLDIYFALCSYEATLEQLALFPAALANAGRNPLFR